MIKMEKEKRKISKLDRKIWRKSALLGTKKWMGEPEQERHNARAREERTEWNFRGRSPRTEDIRHVHVHEHVRHRHGKEYRVREHEREVR